MEKALMVQKGKEYLVSARDVQYRFHGKIPWGISFICPMCRQKLTPASMSSGVKQAPHFRHERNNPRAQECELFEKNYGYFTTYQRVPMPMFIKKSHSREGRFIIEGGFRTLSHDVFSILEREGAKVKVGQKTFNVNSQNFGSGLRKIVFEEVSLNCGSSVRLIGSHLNLNSTWGYPEEARRAMVFTRDADTGQGRRLKIGDTIPFETDLFLLAPESENKRIYSVFTDARKVGVAGKSRVSSNLTVFEVTLTKDDCKWNQGKNYLEECGFDISNTGDMPELIWPPSLTSSGDLLPLFEKGRCVFTANMESSDNGSLYVHTSADTVEKVRELPLRGQSGTDTGFAILANESKLSFITTKNWVFSSAVLLHPNDLDIDEWLHEHDVKPHLSSDSGDWILELACPGEVLSYGRDKEITSFKVEEDTPLSFKDGSFDALQVRRKLGASFDYLVVFGKTFDYQANLIEMSEKISIKCDVPTSYMSKDVSFAVLRLNGKMGRQGGIDRQRALRRESRR